MHRQTMLQTDSMDVWTAVDLEPFLSMEAGKANAKQLPPRKWKWHRAPGDGVNQAVFACNAHKNCTHLCMVKRVDGEFRLFLKGRHTSEDNLYPRTNSPLTFDQRKALVDGKNTGARPAGMRVSLTLAKEAELQEAGKDPLLHKNEDGGLEGEAYRDAVCRSEYVIGRMLYVFVGMWCAHFVIHVFVTYLIRI